MDEVMASVPAAQQCRCEKVTDPPRRTLGRFWRR
ncbi:hypothetical protein MELE44368_04080 [Mycolicibacterium elephantis DSM 44368]|uniref:Uncharacterized protein n=1 Tax=Mycolicibacterium elephantis DSM 44368 TaxID=1335622 RepID=A0A439DRK9_9MYCO|nr:hypothetical protein MELE44368_04080 [Mycolicibacterium elephantis DSM 44368]